MAPIKAQKTVQDAACRRECGGGHKNPRADVGSEDAIERIDGKRIPGQEHKLHDASPVAVADVPFAHDVEVMRAVQRAPDLHRAAKRKAVPVSQKQRERGDPEQQNFDREGEHRDGGQDMFRLGIVGKHVVPLRKKREKARNKPDAADHKQSKRTRRGNRARDRRAFSDQPQYECRTEPDRPRDRNAPRGKMFSAVFSGFLFHMSPLLSCS